MELLGGDFISPTPPTTNNVNNIPSTTTTGTTIPPPSENINPNNNNTIPNTLQQSSTVLPSHSSWALSPQLSSSEKVSLAMRTNRLDKALEILVFEIERQGKDKNNYRERGRRTSSTLTTNWIRTQLQTIAQLLYNSSTTTAITGENQDNTNNNNSSSNEDTNAVSANGIFKRCLELLDINEKDFISSIGPKETNQPAIPPTAINTPTKIEKTTTVMKIATKAGYEYVLPLVSVSSLSLPFFDLILGSCILHLGIG